MVEKIGLCKIWLKLRLARSDNLRTIRWEEVFPNPSFSLKEIKQLLGLI